MLHAERHLLRAWNLALREVEDLRAVAKVGQKAGIRTYWRNQTERILG
jgi:hypothetical protein